MSLRLDTPNSFEAFPFFPYEIQSHLMQHLYGAIEGRKVTIIESPTGTGKTLSLLCASLTWLRDEQERARRGQLVCEEGKDSEDWVLAQAIDRRRRQLEAEEQEYAERLARARQREALIRRAAKANVCKRLRRTEKSLLTEVELDETAYLPEGVEGVVGEDDNISPAVRSLMQKLERSKGTQQQPEQDPVCTKIYYASRTHSQLSQVLQELKKLKLDLSHLSITSLRVEQASNTQNKENALKRDHHELDQEDVMRADVRVVSLGSRKQLCVNEELKAKVIDLDEACRQLLSEKGDRRCSYLPPAEDEARMLDFRDEILATPKDIEELVEAGQSSHLCPYFSSRRAIPQAQLVLLPYNLLLQKTAREALGIDLTNQVVIVDEAHNLISTLLSLSAAHLPLRTLTISLTQLRIYIEKFRNRLTTDHLLHLKRLVGLLEGLEKYVEEWKCSHGEQPLKPTTMSSGTSANTKTEIMTSGELLRRLGRKVEGVNLLEIEKYLRNSKIARKISGYCTKAMEKTAGEDPKKLVKLARLSATTPPLHVVENFILALASASDDGRISFRLDNGQVEINYQHLNPSTYFRDVVEVARSVVLAGGTMSPISDIVGQLFAFLPEERLITFSCGHIIPAANLRTLVVKKGPRGTDLQFKYEQRSNQALIAELGQMIYNFASVVPGGMVIFLPSYSFLHSVVSVWESSKLFDRLKAKKKIFMEPKETSDVDAVLRDYAATVEQKAGAVLLAVVGAKLSEGLNFTDDLARAVVIVGLPFANLSSPELRERMNYVKRIEEQRGGPRPTGAKDAGTELYENMCMNAVNQSIGRAIRHRGDWASLILVDGRYATPRIRGKLPKWIGENVAVTETFGATMKELGSFYRGKRTTTSS